MLVCIGVFLVGKDPMLPSKTRAAILKGLRVRMTMQAILAGLAGKRDLRLGVIVGRQRTDHCIRVRRDGERYARTYGVECWMPANLPSEAALLKPVTTRPPGGERANRPRANRKRTSVSIVDFPGRKDRTRPPTEDANSGVAGVPSPPCRNAPLGASDEMLPRGNQAC